MIVPCRTMLTRLPLSTALRSGLSAALLAFAACRTGAAPLTVQLRDLADHPLSDGVIYLESDAARQQIRPTEHAEMSQQGKRFVPQVLPVTVGTLVAFPNRDTVRHHVYSFSPAKKFELKLYAGTPSTPVLFDREGVVVLGCNIHDQMIGWILVLGTPYFARTDADGRAVIEAPAGAYHLRSWHPGMRPGAAATDQPFDKGAVAQTITVRLDATTAP